jgi:hypothetical protein
MTQSTKFTAENSRGSLHFDVGSRRFPKERSAVQEISPEVISEILDLVEQLRSKLAALKTGTLVQKITIAPDLGIMSADLEELANSEQKHRLYVGPKQLRDINQQHRG